MAFPDGYERKCELVIQASQVDADLTDFPVLLTEANLPSEMFDADGSYPAKDGGGDIRFSLDADGQTQLPCEIEEFSTNNDPSLGKAAIWVKIPSVSSSANTSFFVWYHNPTDDPEQPPADDPYGSENVWDGNFKGVWHLSQDPAGALKEIDSTSNHNYGTCQGSMTSDDLVGGQVGKALSLDGSDDYVDCGNDESLNITDAITIEAWVKHFGGSGHIVNRGGGWSDSGYSLFWLSGNIRIELQDSSRSEKTTLDNTSPSDNVWHHIAFTWDITSKTIRVYIDGTQAPNNGTFNGPIGSPPYNLDIGRNEGRGYYFNGKIDEVRVYNRALSAEEIAEHYYNQNDPASFISSGSPQEGQPITSVALDWSSFDPVLDLLRKTVSLCLVSLFGHGLHVFYTDRSLFQEVENILHSRVKNLPTEDQPLGLELLDFYRRFYIR